MKKFYEDEVYIKMCEAAKEIQRKRSNWEKGELILIAGDYLLSISANKEKRLLQLVGLEYEGRIQHPLSGVVVRLPRQDQLQEMSNMDWIEYNKKCVDFPFDMREIHSGDKMPSKEETGLRVIMKEKFNKTWDGEDWV